jgi:hypothetical protein
MVAVDTRTIMANSLPVPTHMNPPTRTSAPGPFQKLRASDHLVRAVLATAMAEMERTNHPERIARKTWPHDHVTPLLLQRDEYHNILPITRAASSVADTTTAGWAADIATFGLADFLLNMGPASAAAGLLSRALTLSFDRYNALVLPMLLPSSSNTSFVGQKAPIPVRQLSTDVAAIELRKLATILPFSRELLASSSVAEPLVRQIMVESIGLQLDSAMLDATAASATRPAGLRAQVSATSAASAGSDAMMSDLGTLAGAVASVGGLDLAFVADPASAVKMAFNVGPQFNFPILASKALADKTVICVALPALCATINPTPQISVSREATIQMDNAPAAGGLVDGSSTVATNVRSAWQTDSIFVRFIADISGACVRTAPLLG